MANPTPTQDNWLSTAMFSGQGLDWLLLIAAVACGIVVALVAMSRLGPRRRSESPAHRLARLHLDQRGTATIEFALVLPIFLFLSMLLIQSVLAMAGHLLVNYSAYVATRTATLTIPAVFPDEPANTLMPMTGNLAWEGKAATIRRSAVLALVPMGAPDESTGSAQGNNYVAALESVYTTAGLTVPGWVRGWNLAQRYDYVNLNTDVTFHATNLVAGDAQPTFVQLPDRELHTFAPRDFITVLVTHNFYLAVPYARVVFSDGSTGSTGTARYSKITARYTLVNQGVTLDMPPAPRLPRIP